MNMSKRWSQDMYMEEIDEDKILAGLSAEELQQLQNEMDDNAPDNTVPVGMRLNNTPDEATTQGFSIYAVTYHCSFSAYFFLSHML